MTAGLGPETDGLGASSCLSDSVDGGGCDGVDGGLGGAEWWRRMVATGVFDTKGTDVEVPLCPQW